ncbi:hypothetical protein TTHERM_00069450 (macronuclear) [Tetrahymena thermophila SB210]|uniref:Kinase domain protein n=1 Tax=Tetrahymena thermophila (strain SB210) TaxID=312017 RepID=I7LTY7_TETTS|nr:hypothetical protein TTHERM_00069450 [Tetrahymena thermophila SB210]EAR87538.2 hypothetical protein TTHERM_00069450 [Tetrahymena thermophila SB210]|eukprot:XP_001007783.2 hypothetical protein TTHERM_00069450 [Tetrahymena thermophila SB210]
MNQNSSKIEANKENFRPYPTFDSSLSFFDPNKQSQNTPTKPKKEPFQNSCNQNSYIVNSPQKLVDGLLEKAKDKRNYCSITAEEFFNLSTLSLNYFCQSLKNEGANQVFQTVFSMKNLNSLYINLQINEITCLRFEKINYYCQNLTYLKLDLGSNNIAQENGIKSLEDCTKQLTNLKQFYIDLRWNNLTDSNCEQIGSSIKHLKQLDEVGLFLSHNKITSIGVNFICSELKHILMLKKLYFHLSQNKIDDNGAILLSQCIENLKYLQTVDISLQDNAISNQGSIELCKSVSNLEKISVANILLYMNQVRDYGILHSTKQFVQSANFRKLEQFFLEFRLKFREINPSKVYIECQEIVRQNILSNRQHALILTAYKKHITPMLDFQPQYQHWDILY